MSESDPTLDDGFTRVDAQPDPSVLVDGMDETAQWPAVRQLRAWERERLSIAPGDRVLDVGCGLGDVLTSLAGDAQPGGAALGVDASDAMLDVARSRAEAASAPVTFRTADALALDIADDSFDACRSERMLQWVPDVDAAVREMARVLRPGGRLSLIDTDWRTFVADIPDSEAFELVMAAMNERRGPSAAAGGRLLNAGRDLALVDLEFTSATHVWTKWDPDSSDRLPGVFPLRPISMQLAEVGLIGRDIPDRFVDSLETAARDNRLFLSLTMFAVFGRTSG